MVNHLPPEKKKIEKQWILSDYQKLMADELALKLRSFITEICSAVLSEALGETEEGTHNVGI